METFFHTLTDIPWWFYLLFAYLIFLGTKALKPQNVKLGSLSILPLLLLGHSLYNLFFKMQGWSDLFTWALFTSIGVAAGFGLVDKWRVRANRKKLIIHLPGSPMVIILVSFFLEVRYFFGYYYATHAEINIGMRTLDVTFSSLIMGITVGRAYALLKKFALARHENIKLKKKPLLKKRP